MKLEFFDYSDSHYKEYETDEIYLDGISVSEHDKQVRADAIDECIGLLGNNIWDIAKLEQLKEQNK